MRRRVLLFCVVSTLLLVAVFPLRGVVSNQSGSADSSSAGKSTSFTPAAAVSTGVDRDGNGIESLAWNVPAVPEEYVVEVGTIPGVLTSYDSVWIEAK